MSVLLEEYDCISHVSEEEDDYVVEEVANQKSFCYYMINNGVVEEQNAIFEKPDEGMIYLLKPYL